MLDAAERRARLANAKLLLIFTPDLAKADPMGVLGCAMAQVDIVQVRPKALGDRRSGSAPAASITGARDAYDLSLAVLDLRQRLGLEERVLVMVNDRVDVAALLGGQGLDGVHVGADDMPAKAARSALGKEGLLGLSTHSTRDVAAAWDEPVDLLGFGPVFPSATKGYGPGAQTGAPAVLGPEIAWIAAETAPVPLFAIGGIDARNVDEVERVGRVAVGSAILGAPDPALAADALRAGLGG